MSLRLALLPLLLLTLAGCQEPLDTTDTSRPAFESQVANGLAAAMVQNQRSTVDTVVFNDCTGEDIALQGTAHVVFNTTQSGNGGLHQAFASTMVLRGTGLLTGSRYQSASTSNSTFNVSGLPAEQTSVGSSRLLRQGRGGDLFVHFLQHITIDALGNIRVFNSDFRLKCA